MKIIFNSMLMLGAVGVGLGVGFALRHRNASEPVAVSNSSLSSARSPIRSGAFNRGARHERRDESPLATRLEQDLASSSGVTRWLYWMEALEKAAVSDFPRLAGLAEGNPTAMRFVAARWVELAPRHLFDTIVAGIKSGRSPAEELMTTLFREWPRRDPNAAIAALNETDHTILSEWRSSIAFAVMDTDIERGVRLLSEWYVNDIGFGTRGLKAVTKWAQANPRHAAEFMLEQPDGYSVRSTIDTIAKEWASVDPASAMAFAASKPGELGSSLARSVLKEWAGRNLTEATEWLSAAEPRTRNLLSPAFVEVWAKQDPAAALAWCEQNLTGSTLAHAAAGVATGAEDTAAAATLVSAMEPSRARAEAAAALAKKWFPTLASGKPVAPEALEWLTSLDRESVRSVLEKVYWGWATSDVRSMADFLAGSSSDQVPKFAYTVVARELARKTPTDALEWATHLPAERALTAGGAAFAEWRTSQPDAATQWFNELPSDDRRRESFLQSAIQALAYHPQAAEQFALMNPAERTAARSVIEKMDLPPDRRARLLDVLKAP